MVPEPRRLVAELLVDAGAALGEGPVWDPQGACLWWVDIDRGHVHRTDPVTLGDMVIDVGQPVGAVALRGRGGLVAAVRDGFGAVDVDRGTFELHAPVESSVHDARMNDGKADPAGRFWAGTMALDVAPGRGTLYRLDPDWTVTPMLPGLTISNGLDWTDDADVMYLIDSPTGRIDRLAFDIERGTIADRRPAFAIPPGMGDPDGMTLDAEGYLWVALWDGWAVARFAPDGRLDTVVDVPAQQVSCPTFGGRGLDGLFITTARGGLDAEAMARQPHAGGVFVCEPGVRGREANRFRG